MNKYIGIVIALILIVAGFWYYYAPQPAPASAPAAAATSTSLSQSAHDVGSGYASYDYACTDGASLTLALGGSLDTVGVYFKDAQGNELQETIPAQASARGKVFSGYGLTLTAHGETVVVTDGGADFTCTPVPSSDSAPFNFGD